MPPAWPTTKILNYEKVVCSQIPIMYQTARNTGNSTSDWLTDWVLGYLRMLFQLQRLYGVKWNKRWIVSKDMKVSGHGLSESIVPAFTQEDQEKPQALLG